MARHPSMTAQCDWIVVWTTLAADGTVRQYLAACDSHDDAGAIWNDEIQTAQGTVIHAAMVRRGVVTLQSMSPG